MSFHSQRIPPPFVSYPTASATLQAQGCLAEGSRTVSSSGNSLVDAPPTRFQSLAPIASPLADWMKFALLGALIEFARRSFSFIWAALVGMFFITVRFDDDSEAYDYVMVWLSKCNAWYVGLNYQTRAEADGLSRPGKAPESSKRAPVNPTVTSDRTGTSLHYQTDQVAPLTPMRSSFSFQASVSEIPWTELSIATR